MYIPRQVAARLHGETRSWRHPTVFTVDAPNDRRRTIYDLWRGTHRYSPVPAPVQRRQTRFGRPNGLLLSGERPPRAGRLPVAGCELRGGSAAGPTNGTWSAAVKS